MAIAVVLDHPHRYLLRGPRHVARSTLGGVLLLVGIIASVPTFALLLPALAFVDRMLEHTSADSSLEKLPLDIIMVLWVASTATAIIGSAAGIRLLRGKRHLVLFLRRFGFDDATSVVTFAAARSIGSEWRLVTLDDHEVRPLGVPVGTRRLVQVAGGGAWLVSGVVRLISAVLPRAIQVVWLTLFGIVIIDAASHFKGHTPEDFGAELLGSLARLFQPLAAAFRAGSVQQPLRLDLQSAFVVLSIVLAVVMVGMLVLGLVMLVAATLAGPFVALTSTVGAVSAAETSRRRLIVDTKDADLISASIANSSRGIFAPRLVVLRVSTVVWQYAVRRLAAFSSAIVIDVSEPTENLLWEVRELSERFGKQFVIVGELARVQGLAEGEQPAPESFAGRLATLLDGHEVLAYTTDRPGRARFSRALRNTLESLRPSVPVTGRAR